MPLTATDLITLSRLLDEALDLDPAQAEAWLAALPEEHTHLHPKLQQMLRAHRADAHPAFMAEGPRLAGPVDETVAHASDRVGPYRLLHEIGCGGMGSVWLAERADGAYKRQVALKLPRLAWGAGLAERMAREREIGMRLEHPNIARLYDAGVDEHGRPFLALEFVDGHPIDAWCEAQALSVRDRLRLFVQVVKAVAYAHGRLVVHRDLKPSNVLVTPDGQAHLLDFGIAKLLDAAASDETSLTQQQGRVLTPNYASPEQVAGEAITVQSDIYSLGVLLYELLTGTLPITPKRRTVGAVEEAILEGDAPHASSRVKDRPTERALRGEVDAILVKAMQREPGRRYATADALGLDIERHLKGETVAARPDSVTYRLRKTVRRHWLGLASAGAVLVAVLTGSGVAVVQAQRATRSAERERVVKAFVVDVFRSTTGMDVLNAALRPQSARDLLESGPQLIGARFGGQPELQAEVFATVGQIYFDMGAYRLAADYATRQIEILSLVRADRMLQAKALLALAEALCEDHRFAEAEPRARRAAELSRDFAETETLALAFLARAQTGLGHIDEASASLERAERLLEGADHAADTARSLVGRQRGQLLVRSNRGEEAVAALERAIDLATASEGTLSRNAISGRLSLAWILSQSGRSADAARRFDEAVAALHSLGGAHELRAAMATAWFAWKRSDKVSTAERLRVLSESRAMLEKTSMPIPAWFVPQIDFWSGSVMTGAGNIASGVALIETTIEPLWVALDNPIDRFALAASAGAALMEAGRHETAARWLAERIETRRLNGESRHPWAAYDYIYMARNSMMNGRYDEALSTLDAVPVYEPIRGEGRGTPDRYNIAARRTRGELALARGDARAALTILEQAEPGPEANEFERSAFNRIHGQALCEGGDKAAGLATLESQLRVDERDDLDPRTPQLARLRAVTGWCALKNNKPRIARDLAAKSRAAFTTQPGVSPYYKAPLFKLEIALGLRQPSV